MCVLIIKQYNSDNKSAIIVSGIIWSIFYSEYST